LPAGQRHQPKLLVHAHCLSSTKTGVRLVKAAFGADRVQRGLPLALLDFKDFWRKSLWPCPGRAI